MIINEATDLAIKIKEKFLRINSLIDSNEHSLSLMATLNLIKILTQYIYLKFFSIKIKEKNSRNSLLDLLHQNQEILSESEVSVLHNFSFKIENEENFTIKEFLNVIKNIGQILLRLKLISKIPTDINKTNDVKQYKKPSSVASYSPKSTLFGYNEPLSQDDSIKQEIQDPDNIQDSEKFLDSNFQGSEMTVN